MSLTVTHNTPADGSFSTEGAAAWDENHALAGSVAWGEITGTLSGQTDLQSALDAKGTSNFSGEYADLSGKPTLGTAAATAATDYATAAQGDTADSALQPDGNGGSLTGLTKTQVGLGNVDNTSDANKPVSTATQTALDAKQATLVSATNIKTINGSSVLGSGDLVVSGSDPWTYVKLGSDFTISTTSNNNVTGLNFTPAANTDYHVEGYFLLRTATTTTGARPGIAWPTGYADGAAYTQAPNSATAIAMRNGDPVTGTANAASTGLPQTNRSYAGQMQAILMMGASPSGNFQITLASETAAVNVTMKAGSFIRYRTY